MGGTGFGWDNGSGSVDDTLSGSGVVGDYALAAEAFTQGDSASRLMAGGVAVLDTVATLSDPIGSAVSAGVGFILDHLNPLKKWLNELTGDAGAVEGHAEEWKDIAKRLDEVYKTVEADVNHDLAGQTAETLDAYRSHAQGLLGAIDSSRMAAEGMEGAIKVAAAMVEIVHGLVRDAISDIIGRAVSWAAEEFFSLGTATGWVVEQVSTVVAKWVAKLSGTVHALVSAIQKLSREVKELGRAGEALSRFLDKVAGQTGKLTKVVDHVTDKLEHFYKGDRHMKIPKEREAEGKVNPAHRGEESHAPEHEPTSHRGERHPDHEKSNDQPAPTPEPKSHRGEPNSGEEKHGRHEAGDHKDEEKTWGNQAKEKGKEFLRNEGLFTGGKAAIEQNKENEEEAKESAEHEETSA